MTRHQTLRSFRALACATLLTIPIGCKKAEGGAQAGPLEVPVVEVQPQDVLIQTDFVGSIDGVENADIRARVSGYLEKVHFREGAKVKKGDLLFTIDPVMTQAEVNKAGGDVAVAKAQAAKAKADVERLAPLVKTNAVTQQELDHAVAAQQTAEAQILASQGMLASAQASLTYTKVTSPIDGIVGMRKVSIGTLVGQGEPTLLTTVSALDTVRVRFPVSEQLYLKHAAALNRLVDTERTAGQVQMILADGSTYKHRGWLALIDRAVNTSTGTIMIEARFPNPEGILRPGQFARLRTATGKVDGALAVPQRAVIERQSINEILVLGPGNKVERRAIQVGDRVGRYWLITKGLKAGDKVIIEGVQRVKADQVVEPKLVPLGTIAPPVPASAAAPETAGAPSSATPEAAAPAPSTR